MLKIPLRTTGYKANPKCAGGIAGRNKPMKIRWLRTLYHNNENHNTNYCNKMSFIKDHESDKRDLLSDLINVVRDVSSRHSGKLIVTEKHTDIEKLLELWEKILTHGIKSHSILGNVGDLLGIANGHGSQFWSFAEQQLTKHEKERFSQLKNVSKYYLGQLCAIVFILLIIVCNFY